MILKRLFTTPWYRSTAADAELVDAEITQSLGIQALAGSDPGQRRNACKQLLDLVVLRQVSQEDEDAGVRDIATVRLRHLLSGQAPDSPSLSARIDYVQTLALPEQVAYLLTYGQEAELRLAAVVRVEDASMLLDCVLRDPIAAVRLAATDRLETREALERVARQFAKKDKNVYRLARQRLKALAEREQAPLRRQAEALALCERVEKLGRRGSWSQDQTLLELALTQWRALGEPPLELTSRFETAVAAFRQGYTAFRAAEAARQAAELAQVHLIAEKQALLEQLEHLISIAPYDVLAEDAELQAQALLTRWLTLPALPEAEAAALGQRYAQLVQALHKAIEWRDLARDRVSHLTRAITQGETWLTQSRPLDAAKLRQWQAESVPLAAALPDHPAEAHFQAVMQRLMRRLERQIQQAQEKWASLAERLELLEQALDAGGLRKANTLYHGVRADLELMRGSDLELTAVDAAERRLRRLAPRLRELQNWCSWGADQQRQTLCATLEQLADEDLPIPALAEQAQLLREAWKQLDHSGAPVNDALWQRFHAAGERIRVRWRAHQEQQAALRASQRQAQTTLCQQLEDFLDQVDWEQVDWKRLLQAERELRAAWMALGGSPTLQQRSSLEKRFHIALNILDQHLRAERTRNFTYKQDLVAQARAAAEWLDLGLAMKEIKRLQQAWHTTVPSKRSQENSLWRDLRDIGDQVFERRRDAHLAHQQERETQMQGLRALCIELEALAGAPLLAAELTQQLQQLTTQWQDAPTLSLPRHEVHRSQQRWQRGVNAVQQRIQLLTQTAAWIEMDQLQAQANLCAELEQPLLQATAVTAETIAAWQAQWAALPVAADANLRTAMQRRFMSAITALQEPQAQTTWLAALTAQTQRRTHLCLQLEVLAGNESPAEFAQQRLAWQVSRLVGRLREGAPLPEDEAVQVERAWYASGPASAAEAAVLEQRFAKARMALRTQAVTATLATETALSDTD